MQNFDKKIINKTLSCLLMFCLTLGTVFAAGLAYEGTNGTAAAAESYYKEPEDWPVVVLDPGHDSLHNGAHYGGMMEEVLTLKIAQYCREALSDYAVTVCMTREGYSCPHPGGSNIDDNAERAEFAASVGADLMVDFHLNADAAGRYSGAEIYYPNANWKPELSVRGKAASEKIMAELVKLGIENNGLLIRNTTKQEYYPDGSLSDYYGLTVVPKYLDIPAIIVEHCYISSASDREKFLSSEEKLKALGEADARGIIAYFGLEKKKLVGTFDAKYYYENNPDLQTAIGYDPERLEQHFLTYGLSEGRCASPVFDVNFYREKNPDLAAAYNNDAVSLAWHFERVGMEEGRRGSRLFDVYYYRLHEADLLAKYGGDLKAYYLQFMQSGYADGRKASPETDTDAYGNPGHYAEYPVSEKADENNMYRVYDPRTGEHLYTEYTAECEDVLAHGWQYEGVAWTAPKRSAVPVYRLFNPYSGEHHYTTDAAERAALLSLSWRDEGTGWYSAESTGIPVYRLFNPNGSGPGSHHYTVSVHERDVLSRSGWNYEGIAWYGIAETEEEEETAPAEEKVSFAGGYRVYYEEAALPAAETYPADVVLETQRKAAHNGASYSTIAAYTNDVFYNRMMLEERALYDALYQICEAYLSGTENLETVGDYGTFTKAASYAGLTSAKARNVAVVFGLSNPQFYYLSDAVLITHYNGTDAGNVRLAVYENFVDGNVRRTATEQIFNVITPMASAVAAQEQPLDKVKTAHDLICEHVTYDHEAVGNGTERRHQSCYTAFMEGKSVCAGYAEAVALLLNAAGVPTISVTSATHEWNEVYLDGYWYLLDPTWDDSDYGIIDQFYLKSDATVLGLDARSRAYHTKEAFWTDFETPPCRYDYGSAPNDGGVAADQPGYKVIYDIGDTSNVPAGAVPMYRLYNHNTGEHLYTSDANEATVLRSIGWRYEGRAWNAPRITARPVFRLYNPYADEHLYTMDTNERDTLTRIGWRDEGTGWYSDPQRRTPLYRLYNPNEPANNHFYTAAANERDILVTTGWRDEGIGWYGM